MNGHLEKRAKGTYQIIIDLGRETVEGKVKRKRITKTVQGNKKAAEKELIRILGELERGTYIEPSKMTLGEYLDYWRETYAKPNLAPSTLDSYCRIIETHLKPALGHVLLQKVLPMQIQAYYSKALESGRRDGKGGLSRRTVQYHHAVLREALHHAVKWRLIALNPADACEAPRPEKTEMEVFNAEEVRQLLSLTRGHEDEAIIKTALFTGMRQGELLGLRWRDVDLDQKVLHVQQTVGRLPKVGFVFRPCPKNKRSRRLIVLPEIVISALKKHKILKASQELKAEKYAEHNLVFSTPAGEPLDPSALGRRFKELVRQLHRPKMRFHDLRHYVEC